MNLEYKPTDIAIVGMSLVCPGASTVGKFWTNLADGVDAITSAPASVIEPWYFGADDNSVVDRFYCDRGGFITPGVVDPMRYGILPVAAEGADPDQLLSYMLVEDALNDAGVFQKNVSLDRASIIVGRGNFAGLPQLRGAEIVRVAEEFIGLLRHALPSLSEEDLLRVKREYQKQFGRFQGDTAAATMPNLVASGVANHFDMHGPAYCVDAACASGIVALQHASRLLQSGESDLGIVGAMHTAQSSVFWAAFSMMGAMSHRGQIAPFSAHADGLLIGQGAGYMVVKTMERALADDDRIYAVVKSTAVGSDGGGHSVLITDSRGQADVIRRAWKESGLDPQDVAYVETHGTGTPVGDSTELESLTQVFGEKSARGAYLGSVKSNIGHLMPAAGMMGLMKTALALYHRRIPPTLHCEEPLAQMSQSRFSAPGTLIDWSQSGLPLVAGVDAFGFGGIDAHAVMTAYEEPAAQARRYRADRRRQYSPEAYAVAGPTREAVLAKIDTEHFVSQFASVAGQPSDPCRLVIFNPTPERQALAIDIVKRGEPWLGRSDIWYTEKPLLSEGGKIAFLFPGWDASAGVEYDTLVDELGLSTHRYPGETDDPAGNPAINHFKTSLLVHQGLETTGVRADFYGGHSVGEWHAARAAGMLDDRFDQVVFDLTQLPMDALEEIIPDFHLVVANGKLPPDTMQAILDDIPDVYLTNDNCPNQRVFCAVGDSDKRLISALEAHHVVCQVLPFGTALHTPLFKYVIPVPLEAMSRISVHRGKAPVISAVSLEEAPWQGDVKADSFGTQLTEPVYFRELVEKLYDMGVRVFIQSGVGSLTAFVDDTLRGRDFGTIQAISPLRSAVDQLRRVHALLFVMGGRADLDFMGMRTIIQQFKTLFLMPNGSPILTQLPALNEVLAPAEAVLATQTAPLSRPVPSSTTTLVGPQVSSAVAGVGPVSVVAQSGPVPVSPAPDSALPAPLSVTPVTPTVAAVVPLNQHGLPIRGFTRGSSAGLGQGLIGPGSAGAASATSETPTHIRLSPVEQPSPTRAEAATPAPAPSLNPLSAVSQAPAPDAASATQPVSSSLQPRPSQSAPAPVKPSRAGTSFEVPLDLSLEDHPYVLDHSIVNQPMDWPHKEDFYSVVPLTMSIELMAEVALGQAPGLSVAKIGPITAMDFISVTMPFHSTVQGFWKTEYTVALTIPGRLMLDVTLTPTLPDPPVGVVEQMSRDIGDKVMEPLGREEQYVEYSFHRPKYWSALEYTHYGEHGFHTVVRRAEGKGSLLDQMGQSVGLFLHLYMPDNRVSFPVRVKEIAFYQDMFDQDGTFESYCVIRRLTDRFITGDLIYLRDGKIWAIAKGWVNQRLGMELELWESVNHPWRSVLAKQIADGVYYYSAGDPSRSAGYFLVLCYLSAQEKTRADALPNRAAQSDFLAGRVALKDGVRSWLREPEAHYRYPIEVCVSYDDAGRPLVRQDDHSRFPGDPQVSLAHVDGRGVAMVADKAVGVDIEKVLARELSFWEMALTESELALVAAQPDTDQWATRFWVAKEAYAKWAGTGLGGAPKSFVVEQIDGESLRVGTVWIDTMMIDDGYVVGWTRRNTDD